MVPCTLEVSNNEKNNSTQIKTYLMEDCGATGAAFIDESFAQKHNLTLTPLKYPRQLRVVDGGPSSSGDITHVTTLKLLLGHHQEEITCYITKLGQYNMILGIPWLKLHNPHFDWTKGTQTFHSRHCKNFCLPKHIHQLSIPAVKHIPSERKKLPEPTGTMPRRLGAASFDTFTQMEEVEVFSASLYEIDKRLDELGGPPEQRVSTFTPKLPPKSRPKTFQESQTLNVSVMMEELCYDHPDTSRTPEEDKHHLAAALYLNGASLADVEKALQSLEPKLYSDPKPRIPEWLHDILPLWSHKEADVLAPHRPGVDLKINLQPGATPKTGPLYNMSRDELLVLRKWLDTNLEKGFIRASTSPAAAPCLFAKKPGGGLRFCVDYRALNAITIKNRYPLPLIQETLSRLSKAKFYTKLDVIHGFNNIRIAEGDEWLTAFNTRYGLFESLVMPFGLTNAPATFQTRINQILHPFLDVFCTAYIDDILIFSNTRKEHRQHVRQVAKALLDAGLHCEINKCEFEVQEVTYLGMIISTTGVKMDPEKTKAIDEWEIPSSVKDVQGFLGFSNFYRRFIKNFSAIVRSLVRLTKKDVVFDWSDKCNKSFNALKKAFVVAPILRHFDPELEVYVETDASDFVSAGILSQKDELGVLHPIAFMSKKHTETECNYEIYDKELMAIVRCFESWRAELQGSAHKITVLSDHRNLVYFMTTKALTRRQVRWSEFLSQFDFEISWRSGSMSVKPDALTKRSQDLPKSQNDPRIKYQNQALLKPHNIGSPLTETVSIKSIQLSPAVIETVGAKITRLLDIGYKDDEFWHRIKKEMTKPEGIPKSKEISLSECDIRKDHLYFRDRLYIPNLPKNELRTFLLQLAHDSVESGHPGGRRMFELVSRDYFWPGLQAEIDQFCANCHLCHRNKGSQDRYKGALKPLPLPSQRWRHISVDFIGPIITSKQGNNGIMNVVDRLTKEKHSIPCKMTMTAEELAQLFVQRVWCLHGLPDSIISDRGSLFVSQFWRAICHKLQVEVALSTAFHPETDGQTEIANKATNQYLRMFVNYAQDDWEDWLPLQEFASNNSVNMTTGVSPFMANKGFHPRVSFGPPRSIASDSSKTLKEQNEAGNEFVQKMEDILTIIKTNMRSAQEKYETQANQKRDPAPAYRIGDEVYLNTKNLTTDRPHKKFDIKFAGPLQVTKVVGSHAYKLQLPAEMGKVHKTFHTNLLKPAPNNPLPGQTNPPPLPVTLDQDGEKLWAIEAILDSKRERGTFKYYIHWRGYDASEQSWEPLKNVVNAYKSIQEFQERFPAKLKPTKKEIQAAKRAKLG